MKKLKLKALELGAADVLTRTQLKNVSGGSGGTGACYFVYSDQGYSSCWYTTGSELALCERVYPNHCDHVSSAVDCEANNCTMN